MGRTGRSGRRYAGNKALNDYRCAAAVRARFFFFEVSARVLPLPRFISFAAKARSSRRRRRGIPKALAVELTEGNGVVILTRFMFLPYTRVGSRGSVS